MRPPYARTTGALNGTSTPRAAEDRGPLESALSRWAVGWGGAAAEGAREDAGSRGQPQPPPGDWEALLRKQNAANDELCSENGRLRAELERLRVEARFAEAEARDVEEASRPEAEELLRSVVDAIGAAVSRWSESSTASLEAAADAKAADVESSDTKSAEAVASAEAASDDEAAHAEAAGAEASHDASRAEAADAEAAHAEAPNADGASAEAVDADAAGINAAQAEAASAEAGDAKVADKEVGDTEAACVEVGGAKVVAAEVVAVPADAAIVEASLVEAAHLEPVATDTDAPETIATEAVVAEALDAQSSPNVEVIAPEGVDTEAAEVAATASTTPLQALEAQLAASLDAAVCKAFREEAESTTPAPALSPGEETAVLVAEKVALRELVERQQEQVRLLERELGLLAPPAAPAAATAAATATATAAATATSSGLSAAGSSGLSAAAVALGGSLSAGVREGLSAVLAAPPRSEKVALVGVEYEVVGRSGAIVRQEESLRSSRIGELPPGSRVRVVALSANYPRRVEVVSVSDGFFDSGLSPGVAGVSAPRAPARPTAPGGLAPSSASGAGSSPEGVGSTPVSAIGASVEQAQMAAPRSGEGALTTELAASPSAASEASATIARPIVGWISAVAKDGRNVIRPVATQGGVSSTSPPCAGDSDGREEGTEEVSNVTLSTSEWECLHQDAENSLARVKTLTCELHDLGRGLLQSFEMRSVLGELQLGVARAEERLTRARETAALAAEELEQRRAQCIETRRRRQAHELAAATAAIEAAAAGEDVGDGGRSLERSHAGGVCEGMKAVDWDRLLHERETTAQALSAALHRLTVLEREAEELRRERDSLDQRGRQKLGDLRKSLRNLARPTLKAVSRAMGGSTGRGGATPTEALFLNRIDALKREAEELRVEVGRTAQSEAALRRSVDARSKALRRLLHQGATAALRTLQCGPLQLQPSVEAEREALRTAVEEQLLWSMRGSHGAAPAVPGASASSPASGSSAALTPAIARGLEHSF